MPRSTGPHKPSAPCGKTVRGKYPDGPLTRQEPLKARGKLYRQQGEVVRDKPRTHKIRHGGRAMAFHRRWNPLEERALRALIFYFELVTALPGTGDLYAEMPGVQVS